MVFWQANHSAGTLCMVVGSGGWVAEGCGRTMKVVEDLPTSWKVFVHSKWSSMPENEHKWRAHALHQSFISIRQNGERHISIT